MAIISIIACNCFGFKGAREFSLSVWLLIPLLFPPFSQAFLITGGSQATYVS